MSDMDSYWEYSIMQAIRKRRRIRSGSGLRCRNIERYRQDVRWILALQMMEGLCWSR